MESKMAFDTTKYYLDPAESLDSIMIENDGSRIAATNYWGLPLARVGLCYLSGNAGDWRLLLPGRLTEAVHEFRTVRRAIIEPSIAIAGQIEIVAVDGSASPYCVCMGKTMIDRSIFKKRCRLLIYTEEGLINNIPVKVRA